MNKSHPTDTKPVSADVKTIDLLVEYNHPKAMHAFLQECREDEIDAVAPEKVNTPVRYVYRLIHADSTKSNAPILYNRTKFHTHKTFNSIFFSEKARLIRTVDDFENHTGAWSPIRERTHKLVIMMSSAPGFGKTSCLKALAKRTSRHLFVVNPTQCKTDTDLQTVFQSPSFQYVYGNRDTNFNEVPLSERIIVMEDLDASGCDHLLHRATKPTPLHTIEEVDFDPVAEELYTKKVPNTKKPVQMPETTFSGFLNALDGISELEDVIIVITTNCPDKFDHAFVRPGRVDLMLELKGMTKETVKEMIEYYFQPEVLNDNQVNQVNAYMQRREEMKSVLAPCIVEELCQLAENAGEAVEKLLKLVVV
jgi:SpoVK/Ycf46/Vps4 family AAA+-type ATPase